MGHKRLWLSINVPVRQKQRGSLAAKYGRRRDAMPSLPGHHWPYDLSVVLWYGHRFVLGRGSVMPTGEVCGPETPCACLQAVTPILDFREAYAGRQYSLPGGSCCSAQNKRLFRQLPVSHSSHGYGYHLPVEVHH